MKAEVFAVRLGERVSVTGQYASLDFKNGLRSALTQFFVLEGTDPESCQNAHMILEAMIESKIREVKKDDEVRPL